MIRRVWIAYTLELAKAIRAKSTYVGPALVILAVLCTLLVHPVQQDGRSDYEFVAKATPLALNLLGWLLLLTYCAGLVSSELGSGSIRLLLVRPLLRREFLAAKLLHGMTYALVLTLCAAGTSWVVALTRGELVGVGFGGEVMYTAGQMLRAYLIGAALALIPQFAAVAYAVMASTLTRSTGAAVIATVGVWVLVDFVKYPLRVAPFLFSTYLEAPWQTFADRCNGFSTPWLPMGYYCLGTSLAALILFSCVATAALNRRNLQV
ncbi:MAG: ABC transporter permease subunit [Candidatus Hydrogenedentes bacterium]|nr:ABC transporter permease subunit [Candidatus Hydrogenedentota bacterium]